MPQRRKRNGENLPLGKIFARNGHKERDMKLSCGFYYLPGFGNSIQRPLRRTLVLQQFYSSIVAVACPDTGQNGEEGSSSLFGF